MTLNKLDKEFKLAVESINNHQDPFPADTLLKLYAYYKKATNNYSRPNSSKPIINAFKTNAIFQVDNISEEEAKKRYIELSKKYLLNRSK
ncbi:MAG: acyl-CoA-binding protein [Flavobacteriaceae bacterium]|jgi:acyl-CoA-binding protein|tara:strand:+ start:159 stop:428 length:270 start_codon:yes stop_codon:yes gene_type:complete